MDFHDRAMRFSAYRRWFVGKQLFKITSLAKKYRRMSDQDIIAKSRSLKFRAQSGECINQLIAESFALAQEACFRALAMRHFEVQLGAGVNLVSKQVVEMATGEGKTLTAILPLYLYALFGKGALLATANDYLAQRDAEHCRTVFELLGISVGVVQHQSSDPERKIAYQSDVTYGTIAEFGFDFLRDRMKRRMLNTIEESDVFENEIQPVCRKPYFMLVDEADSIMIDDASTPLIIGAPTSKNEDHKLRLYRWAALHAPGAIEQKEYRYIEHRKKVELTESGRNWTRQKASSTDIATLPIVDMYEFMERAIKVERNYHRDRNYVVANGEVTIVDENTGRLAVGRFWQDGLHQAIQAREELRITMPTASAARLTIQSLVLSFPNRAGMTGTALAAKREFRKVYKMGVVRIATRRPCRRKKLSTCISNDESEKLNSIRDSVLNLIDNGRPVLIGSHSVAKSERLSQLFTKSGIEHEVLNARHEALEAGIVAKAGLAERVTISTSMAGRGTDIKISEIVASSGGLHVIVTELNESQRIDRQLLGRCARQGDPGSFQLFLSPEDFMFDPKNKNQFWEWAMRLVPFIPTEWVFKQAQKRISKKKIRQRLEMFHNEKKRLRALRQAGLDPVLDVVG